jgi:hypothetical protein
MKEEELQVNMPTKEVEQKKTKDQILKEFFLERTNPEKKLQAGYAVWEKDFLKFFFLTYANLLTWYEKETFRLKGFKGLSEMHQKMVVEFVQFDGEKFSKKKTFSFDEISRENAPRKKQ